MFLLVTYLKDNNISNATMHKELSYLFRDAFDTKAWAVLLTWNENKFRPAAKWRTQTTGTRIPKTSPERAPCAKLRIISMILNFAKLLDS